MDILGEMERCCGPAHRSVRRAQRRVGRRRPRALLERADAHQRRASACLSFTESARGLPRRFGPLSLVAYLDILNVYGRENGDALGWDERRGVNIIEGRDEPLPTIGLRAEYSLDARRMS
jgi:hypothetical protein